MFSSLDCRCLQAAKEGRSSPSLTHRLPDHPCVGEGCLRSDSLDWGNRLVQEGERCYRARMPFGIGIWELLILLLVLLLVFGPKRLPEMGRQLGRGMREFKDSVTGKDRDDDDDDRPAELPPASSSGADTPARERESVS